MAATLVKMIYEREVIVIDSSSSEGESNGNGEEEKEEKRKMNVKKEKRDGDGGSGLPERSVLETGPEHLQFKSRAEEYKMLADLSSLPGLATIMAAEAAMRDKNRIRNQRSRINKKLKMVNLGVERNGDSGVNQLIPSESGTNQTLSLQVNKGVERNGDSVAHQKAPSESGTEQMLSADDTENLKMVSSCRPDDATLPRCSSDGPQGSSASGVPLSSSSGEKATGDKCCTQVQLC